jgi:hypothetical protein
MSSSSGYTEPIGGTTSDPSTTRFGNKPIRAVMKLFSGVELDTAPNYGSDYIPEINTPFDIRHSKLRLRDDDGSHYTDFLMAALAANQRLRIPVLENEESGSKIDDVMLLNQTQTFKKKTIPITGSNPNVIQDLTATDSHLAAFDAGGALVKLAQVTNAQIPTTLSGKTINTLSNQIVNLGVFRYQIFKSGTTYCCRDNLSGSNVAFGSDPLPVLRYPLLNGGGSVFVHAATYVLPALTGGETVYLDFPTEPAYVQFYMDLNAWLEIPNGFANTVIRLKNSSSQHTTNHKLGVNMYEAGNTAGTTSSNWIGILTEATGNTIKGVYDTRIEYFNIRWPGIGIKYNCDAACVSGFLTANFASRGMIWGPKTAGIDFGMDVAYTLTPVVNGIHRHRFRDITIQAISTKSDSAVGVRDIRHRDLKFDGVYCADFLNNGTAKTSTIHADADSVIIDGGSMTVNTSMFTDSSTTQSTKIRDQYRHTQIGRITPGQSGVSIDIIPTGTTNTTSWYNSATSERFWIRKDGVTNEVYIDSIKQLTAGALRPIIFRMNDIFGSVITESFRVETDASLRIANNKLRLRDAGNDHNVTITVPDVAGNYDLAIPAITGNTSFLTAQSTVSWANVNKTGSVLSDIANVILTTPAEYDILYRNASNQWVNLPKGTNNRFLGINGSGQLQYNFVANANVLAHTSTQITITNKAQLNSQIGYKDETGWLTGAMMAAPNVFQLIKLPTFGMKKGGYTGTSTSTGWGIMGGLTAIGTFAALDIDTTYGSYAPRNTGNVAGNNAGFSYANALTMRKFNPILAVLVRTSHVSLNRMYIGWKSTAASPTPLTDDPLSGLSGVMFLQRSGDTTWRVISNDGTGSTVVDTGATISNTIPSNLQIRAIDASSKWQWSTDGGDTWTDVTGTFPAQTTKLFYVGESQTNEGVIHRLDTFAIEVASDK